MGKIIRFYPNLQSDKPMDMLTIEDLRAEGFVQYRFVNHFQVPTRGYTDVIESQQYMVHQSIPVDRSHRANKDVPYIEWQPGAGYEARWGAMTWHLTSETALWQFMKFFNYPISIDQPNEAAQDAK